VIVPGAAQTATNFNGTADGREGWTQYFLRRGYAVYMVEQPGRARSSYQPATEGPQAYPQILNVQQRFTAPEKYNLWPQARLHTQWIGTGLAGDENFDQFFASQVPFVPKSEVTQALNRDALVALIDKLGPVVVMVHSQSGAYGLLASDQRPQLVKALIVVEGAAPTVHDIELIGAPEWFRDGPASRPWGISAIPITYAPPASDASPNSPSSSRRKLMPRISPNEDADLDRKRRGVVLRGVRSLPGEVPGAGWGAAYLPQSRRHGYSWQRPHDDAGEELRPDRRRDGEMGPQVNHGVDRCGEVARLENSSAFCAFLAVPAGNEDALASPRRSTEDDVTRIRVRHRSAATDQPAEGHFSSDVGGRHLPVRTLSS
jgi:pimeloyl-ACP methyl ester carboxylesterase